MAFLDHEEFRVLFLDKKNHLIADEVQGVGTVDQAPVYPGRSSPRPRAQRSSLCTIIRRAIHGLRPTTSTAPHQIIAVGKPLKVAVHVII
jgi:DNA repair protein RadC